MTEKKKKQTIIKKISDYQYFYGIKMRIYPSDKQKEIIRLNADIARTLYNKFIELNNELYQLKQVKMYIKQVEQRKLQLIKRIKTCKSMSDYYIFMQDKRIDSLAKANAKMNYQAAWNMFHKIHQHGTPKFHKKAYYGSYSTNPVFHKNKANEVVGSLYFIDNKHVKVPKIGRLRVSGSQARILNHKDDFRIGRTTISYDSDGKYYLSMQLASDTPFVKEKPKTGKELGVDLNLSVFLADSNGQTINNPRFYQKMSKRLAKAQRKLSHKKVRAIKEKRSLRLAKNYQKQRRLIAKLHEKIRNRRTDFVQKVTTALINSHDLVVAERLQSKNLLKNHALAKSIQDAGWREFLASMEYKAKLYGKSFIMVDPKNTTQRCSHCGFIKESKDKITLAGNNLHHTKHSEYVCYECGYQADRDINAAKNILAKGLKEW